MMHMKNICAFSLIKLIQCSNYLSQVISENLMTSSNSYGVWRSNVSSPIEGLEKKLSNIFAKMLSKCKKLQFVLHHVYSIALFGVR